MEHFYSKTDNIRDSVDYVSTEFKFDWCSLYIENSNYRKSNFRIWKKKKKCAFPDIALLLTIMVLFMRIRCADKFAICTWHSKRLELSLFLQTGFVDCICHYQSRLAYYLFFAINAFYENRCFWHLYRKHCHWVSRKSRRVQFVDTSLSFLSLRLLFQNRWTHGT